MNSELKNQMGNAEFAEIEADINELESYFGDLGLDDDDQETSSSELTELDIALVGSEFATGGAESSAGPSTFLEMADGVGEGDGEQEEFLGISNPFKKIRNPFGFVAKQAAKKAIKWALKYVKKAAKYRKCAGKLALAISAYKRRKYGTALKHGYACARCIRAQF